jgi:environmental stress-induced protein Ves
MIVQADRVARQPWKNGGGQTRELLSDAAAGAAWRWRISLADIEADGPFSAFPGVQRWFAVLSGAGVELRFGDGVRRVLAGDEALAFDGAAAPGCRLLDGPTRDLNLMLRNDAGVRGTLRRVQPGAVWSEDWPLRGRFDTGTRTLAWHLPAGPLTTEAAGFWIGIAP